MNSTKTRLPRALRFLLAAVAAVALFSVAVLLLFPSAAPAVEEQTAESAPSPSPTPKPTPAPTPTPVRETVLDRGESIYYHFDPSLFSTDERGRITYLDPAYDCLTGIDVSEHQYDIDWRQVAADGIDFAIIRAGYRGYTSGGLHEDKYFQANMNGAAAAGIPVGVYFFSQATSAREAREEAAFVLDLIEDYEVTMPVIFDMEILSRDYRTYDMSRRTLYRCTQAFCDAVAEAGYEPMIYMTQYLGYQKYTLRELTDYGFWFAEYYVNYPSFAYDFELWQYSDTGSVNGVEGNVDLDLLLRKRA